MHLATRTVWEPWEVCCLISSLHRTCSSFGSSPAIAACSSRRICWRTGSASSWVVPRWAMLRHWVWFSPLQNTTAPWVRFIRAWCPNIFTCTQGAFRVSPRHWKSEGSHYENTSFHFRPRSWPSACVVHSDRSNPSLHEMGHFIIPTKCDPHKLQVFLQSHAAEARQRNQRKIL